MENSGKLKLFISYSHLDEDYIKQFIKHIVLLKDNGLIEEWYDRKILAGQDFQDTIDNNLSNAEVICLFISANFLSSPSCKKEINKSFELMKKKFITVIPVILSPCSWTDEKNIGKLLAFPTDGKAVSTFENMDLAWLDVYENLKKRCLEEIKYKTVQISEEFRKFLQDTEMLSEAHPQKTTIYLDDIFVAPTLNIYNNIQGTVKKIDFEELLLNIYDFKKILIAGADQSGKTTLCKRIFTDFKNRNLLPVYIIDKENQYRGLIDNKIEKSFKNQYININFEDVDKKRIVPIIDEFHFAKDKERNIKDLNKYPYNVLIVDDIFCLNMKDEKMVEQFESFIIKEFKPSLRNKLITKWVNLSDTDFKNDIYNEIDKNTELINTTLGKIFGKGIMPAFPFFILTAIVSYQTFAKPLDQEITSQGYCYQALIYYYLRKMGVRNEDIDIYLNFLTELANQFYKLKKSYLTKEELELFISSYSVNWNLPIKPETNLPIDSETLLNNLQQIIFRDSFNNYSFHYLYLYYFFVGKYIAENYVNQDTKVELSNIMNNLHVNRNAYIAVFVVHHSKDLVILEEIEVNALTLFDKYPPAELTKSELKFFDEEANNIIKATLPPSIQPEGERKKLLEKQDLVEQTEENAVVVNNSGEFDPLERELRRAIKTVEVVGSIVRNRIGSLTKIKIEEMFEEAMNVQLRIMYSFFELIKNKEQQKSIISYISERLQIINDEKNEGRSKIKELELSVKDKIAKNIFWNINFNTVYFIFVKTIHSLGNDNLSAIVKSTCDRINTPATFIIKQGILMWYNKTLDIDEIANRIKQNDFSEIAERIMKYMVVNHCVLHEISYTDKQKIENTLGIPKTRLLQKPVEL